MSFTWMALINFNPDFIKFSFDAKCSAIYMTHTRSWKHNPRQEDSMNVYWNELNRMTHDLR